jgi:hypothetical protein
MTTLPVLFFARGYQADFFPTLACDRYQALFATLTRAERACVVRRGGQVVGCFEEDYADLTPAAVPPDYLLTSFMSDRFLGRFRYAKRLEILGKEIAFWRRLLDTYRPVAVVNELVAIEISEVLLIECRARGIRYLAGMHALVENFFYWLSDPMTLSGRSQEWPTPGAESRAQARSYLTQALQPDHKPFYVRHLSGRRSLKPLLIGSAKLLLWRARRVAGAASGSFRYENYEDEYAKRVAVYFKALVHSYDRLEDLPAGREVIYYPLHQEPEATLNYMSELYSNQPATIENILKCLNSAQVLVVKEHPVDKGSLLRAKFWRLRRDYSALYLLPAEVPGHEVLAAAARVVTLASTAGWEAALLGKPVYVLGQSFYDHLSVVHAATGFEELKRGLRTSAPRRAPDVATIEEFVASMTEQSYPGNPFPHAQLYSERNRECVIDAIVRALPAAVGSPAASDCLSRSG